MVVKYTLLLAALASQVVGFATILDPPFRNVVGPATKKACGTGVTNYLAGHPGGDIPELEGVEDSGFNSDACNLNLCGGYQFSDTPVSHVTVWPASQTFNITVNYTIPSTAPAPTDLWDSYAPQLIFMNATTGYAMWDPEVNSAVTGPQVLHHESIAFINIYDPGTVPVTPGGCSKPGECYISFQFVNRFESPGLISTRILDAACVDIIVDWNA